MNASQQAPEARSAIDSDVQAALARITRNLKRPEQLNALADIARLIRQNDADAQTVAQSVRQLYQAKRSTKERIHFLAKLFDEPEIQAALFSIGSIETPSGQTAIARMAKLINASDDPGKMASHIAALFPGKAVAPQERLKTIGRLFDDEPYIRTLLGVLGALEEPETFKVLTRLISPQAAWRDQLFNLARLLKDAPEIQQALSALGTLEDAKDAKALVRIINAEKVPKSRQVNPTQLVPIVSFPKSGNTWIRSFVSHLCFDGGYDAIPDKYSQELNSGLVYSIGQGKAIKFYKSHDERPEQCGLTGDTLPALVIHISRHPLDVFLSQLNFLHLPKDKTKKLAPTHDWFSTGFENIDEIIDHQAMWAFLGAFSVHGTLNPRFAAAGSWFAHMEAWLNFASEDFKIHSLRYEDLLQHGATELYELGDQLGKSRGDVDEAFAKCNEATALDGKFFWRQRAGLYKELIPADLQKRFADLHGERIARLGYGI